jgi:hypothetical protein
MAMMSPAAATLRSATRALSGSGPRGVGVKGAGGPLGAPRSSVRALAARPVPRRPLLVGGLTGLATAHLGAGANQAAAANLATPPKPSADVMSRPAVAAISSLTVGQKLAGWAQLATAAHCNSFRDYFAT